MVGSLDKNFFQITNYPMAVVNKNLLKGNLFGNVVEKQDDEILPSGILTNLEVGAKQAYNLPIYAYRGLKGDPDANFHEGMQLSKIPYYLGGPVLVWTFKVGEGHPLKLTKQKGVGVLLYYLGIMAANESVNLPVKILRGVDLKQKYIDLVDIRPEDPAGTTKRKTEYHDVFESIDFTRWDLLYNKSIETSQNPKLINENYDKIAKKMGLGENLTDSDSAVQPYMQKLIVMSKAWKYFLAVPFVGLAIGLSSQDVWKNWKFSDFKNGVSKAFAKKPEGTGILKKTAMASKTLANALKEASYSPLKTSLIDFWAGKGLGGISKYAGKFVILATILSILAANITILSATQARNKGKRGPFR